MVLTIEEKFEKMMNCEDPLNVPAEYKVTVQEVLSSGDASILIPQVLTGVMREAAEPQYIGTKMLQRVTLQGTARSITIPSIGDIVAHDIPEDGPYPEETVDFQLHEAGGEIKVGKTGLIVRVTEEAIENSQWDIIGVMMRKAGRAMARLKEEKAFNMLSRQGHTVFDNDLKTQYPEAGTTGRDYDGKFNNTMSTEDFLDLILCVMANGFNPTDVLMHPLCWLVFAKNEILGSMSFGALGQSSQQFELSPNSLQGRIPFPITINFSPWATFDRVNKKFNIHVVDRNEVGILLVKEDISTEQWNDPERDIRKIKVKERYGMGVLNDGKAIASAKNIDLKVSYPLPERAINVDVNDVDVPTDEVF